MEQTYQTNRLGYSFAYEFGPKDGITANTSYTLVLLFCELYFSSPNQRVFTVTANGGQILLQDFDVFVVAGSKPKPIIAMPCRMFFVGDHHHCWGERMTGG